REREPWPAPPPAAVEDGRQERRQEQQGPRVLEAEAHAASGEGWRGPLGAEAAASGRSKEATQSRAACHSSNATGASGRRRANLTRSAASKTRASASHACASSSPRKVASTSLVVRSRLQPGSVASRNSRSASVMSV